MKAKSLFIGMMLSLSLGTQAQKNSINEISKLTKADTQRLVDIFKDIHANPERGFMEVRTAAIVAKELKALGYEVKTEIGKTGVVGILKNGNGPTVMYRADMDCNSVKEVTGLPYASTKVERNEDGIEVPLMHACGHDAHVTWMLGIAKIMVALKDQWNGTLVLVGQPAEEPGTGAMAMAKEMYDKGVPVADYLLGMHTAPMAVGYYLNDYGDRMAGADQLDVTFYGVGGHGSAPQETKDPILMAANAVIQYQTIISRRMDPQRPAVLTVGAIDAGIDNNVIPGSATLKLNLRWFKEQDRKIMLDGIDEINKGIALANGLPTDLYPTVQHKQYVKPLVNNKGMVVKLDPILEQVAGKGKNMAGYPPVMGSEDFQHLINEQQKSVYNYLLVGIADPKLVAEANSKGQMFPFFNHNGNFQVDLTAIPFGVNLGANALLEMFKK
ncbi:MAG: hypothetical protein RL662_1489 [Bacteroidota bacterium]|jgi:hippurate hydrolase